MWARCEGSLSKAHAAHVQLWSQSNWECSLTLRGHKDEVWCIAASQDALFSASKDGTLKVWRPKMPTRNMFSLPAKPLEQSNASKKLTIGADTLTKVSKRTHQTRHGRGKDKDK
jgi:WD40 repeat protein